MSLEENYTEDSDNSLSDVRALVDDLLEYNLHLQVRRKKLLMIA
jgi:hypothetical protein